MTVDKDDRSDEFLKRPLVQKTVHALLDLHSKKMDDKDFFGDFVQQSVQLQLVLKKIPRSKNISIKIDLPHSHHLENADVGLFVKDLDRNSRDFDATSRHFKELLSSKGVSCISEIIPLQQLMKEYQPYEAKRKLSNHCDVFLADARIIRRLPKLLGSKFYGRKRIPLQVNLEATDLQKEIKRALHLTMCSINGGSSCLIPIGNTQMAEAKVADNILRSVCVLAQQLPGGSANIHSLHLKLTDSPALPLYFSRTSGAEVTLPDLSEEQEEIDEPEEVTTVNSGKVRVMRDGSIHVVHEGKEGQVTKTAILKFTGRCRTKYVSGDPVKQQKKKEDAKKETKARGDKDKSKRGARSKKEESQEEATKESSDEVETVEVKSLRKRKTAKVSKQKEEASGKEAAAGPKRGKRKATEESDVSPKQKVIKKAVMPKKTPVQKKQAGKKRAK